MRRLGVPVLVFAALVATGCAGSDANGAVDSADTNVADDGAHTDVDLADGAFERNAGSQSEDGTVSAPPETTTPVSGSALNGPSSTSPGVTGGGATGVNEDGSNGAGSTTGAAGSAGTTGSDSGTGTTGSGTVPRARPGEGIIVVGGEQYVFALSTCEFDAESALVDGSGRSSQFDRFDASIYYSVEDFDNDGVDDLTLDVVIDFEMAADGEANTMPELYAGKVESRDFVSGADITVAVEGRRIFGAGPMIDFNGVVFPVDEPGAMTFDARCS